MVCLTMSMTDIPWWVTHCVIFHPSSFGSGQVTVSKYMGPICSLLGDANSQVRSCAMETIVNIYRHVGVKVRIDVSRRNLQQSHLAKLNAQFDAVDATTGNSKSDNEVSQLWACVMRRGVVEGVWSGSDCEKMWALASQEISHLWSKC